MLENFSSLIPGLDTFAVLPGTPSKNDINGTDGADTLNGGPENDTINGRGGADTINGRGGADTINGGNGNDTIDGGAGDDTINGGNGNDVINGRAGDDTINGGNGNDVINGGAGRDTLNGDAGNDTLQGGAGRDLLIGAASTGKDEVDELTGGDGPDTFVLGTATQVFYDDGNRRSVGEGDYALITDFGINSDRDVIQLKGSAELYELDYFTEGGITSAILSYNTNEIRAEAIAVLQNVPTTLNLSSSAFNYV